jgi:hypothetical protein
MKEVTHVRCVSNQTIDRSHPRQQGMVCGLPKGQQASAQVGIVPHDEMAPLIETLAELPDELDRRIDARLDKHESKLEKLLERAERFTDADVVTIAGVLAGNVNFELGKRTVRTWATVGGTLLLLGLVLGWIGTWWFFEHENAAVLSWGRAAMSQCATVATGAQCHPTIKVGEAPS